MRSEITDEADGKKARIREKGRKEERGGREREGGNHLLEYPWHCGGEAVV